MRDGETLQPGSRAGGLTGSGQGGSRMFALLSLAVAASTVTVALMTQMASDVALLILLASCAVLGVFFILGAAAGLIRVGERAEVRAAAREILESLDAGVLVTDRNGDPLYVNNDLALLAARNLGGLFPLGAVSTVAAAASEPLFRLTQAAARGEAHSEQFGLAASGETRWVKADVRPFHPFGPASGTEPLILWHIYDLTAERGRYVKTVSVLEDVIARYDQAPVGLLATAKDNTVTHANATFARWAGTPSETLSKRDVKLDDLLSSDGVQLLSARLQQAAGTAVDLDLTREDGSLMPVRLLAQPAGDGLSIAVLNHEEEARDERLAEVRFARFFRSSPFGIATVGPDGRIVSANAAFSRMMLDCASGVGEPAAEAIGRHALPAAREALEAGLRQVLSGRGKVAPVDVTLSGRGERSRRLYMSPVTGSRRVREAAILYSIDSSEQKALEAKFAQSQKMDAIGKLAGGIAHDFNNVLTVIIGYSDLLLQKCRPRDPAYQEIMNIKSIANRAASLVGKLLAFSHQQPMNPEPMRIEEVLTDLAPFLKRSIGEKVDLEIVPARDVWGIKADRTQIDHVIINLAVNARDAMPEGGKVSIRLRNVTERESLRLARTGLAPGEYVLIEVEDTGTGMSPEVMEKIFEPFFTTKGVGKGTGLGLSTVYGIVKQTGGFIFPESTVGKGTTFRIYLPRYEPEGEDEAPKPAKTERKFVDLTGTARILLVEDEDMVRGFTVQALKSKGYEVIEAATGAEAIEAMETHAGRIDIVISDVVMPEMDGPSLLKALRKKNPGLKFVFVSGYPNEAFRTSLDENETFAFLPKPYTFPQLVTKIKEELGR